MMGMQKAIIALILAVLQIIEIWSGWKSGITEEWLITVLAVLGPILVWAIPNR